MNASTEKAKAWRFFKLPDGSWEIYVPRDFVGKGGVKVKGGEILTLEVAGKYLKMKAVLI